MPEWINVSVSVHREAYRVNAMTYYVGLSERIA